MKRMRVWTAAVATLFAPTDNPPQRNGAKCGSARHTIAKGKGDIFATYMER